ncbi:MAG: glycosyltransferase, partial [Ilumatobacteraceae bacterium]
MSPWPVGAATSGMQVHVFVAPDGNGFMRDIASWIAEAAAQTGATSAVVTDRLPAADGSINLVVAPHEFYLLRTDSDAAIRAAARCSVPVCTEQPGTPWFLLSLGFCVGSPLVIDINATGTAAIEREGFEAVRLALGAVPSMDRRSVADERDIDVLFLGGDTPERSAKLASLAPALWDRHAEIRMFSSSRPITGNEPGVVFGTDKYDLLARSKVLVNLHRSDDDHGYFEWARMVEAMANGCVVVSEPSHGFEPLVPGVHFVQTDRVADALVELLDDPDHLQRVGAEAHRAVTEEQPLVRSLASILDRCASIGTSTAPARRRDRAARRPIPRGHAAPLMPPY